MDDYTGTHDIPEHRHDLDMVAEAPRSHEVIEDVRRILRAGVTATTIAYDMGKFLYMNLGVSRGSLQPNART